MGSFRAITFDGITKIHSEIADGDTLLAGNVSPAAGNLTLGTASNRTLVANLSVGTSFVAPSGTIFPGTPADGEFFWREDERVLYRYNGTTTTWETTKPDELDTLENTGPTLYAPHGFTTWADSTINFADGSLTFSITPVGGSFFYYHQGVKHVHAVVDSVVLPNTSGLWFIYYDASDTLTVSTIPWNLFEHVPVATVYWNSGTAEGELAEERHMVVMDPATHLYLHLTNGTRYESGLVLSGYSLDVDTDAAVTLGVSNGIIADEDIRIPVTNSATPTNPFEQILQDPAQIPVYYRTGAAGIYEKDTATDFWFKNTASGRVNLNEYTGGAWQQTEAISGNFIAYWVFGTNHVSEPIISIQGQRQDTTLSEAQENAGIGAMDFGTLVSKEAKILYRLIVQTDDTFGGTRKAKLVDVTDLRTENAPGGTFVASSHASLGDLTTSGHPADVIVTNITNFTDLLSGTDTTTQAALDTIDDSLSTVAPVAVDKSAAVVGTSRKSARSDHKHDIDTATAGAVQIGDAAAEGSSTNLSRADHIHSVAAPAAPANVTKSAAATGVATSPARADHKHDVTTGTPVTASGNVNQEGTATSLARSDHKHAIGGPPVGTTQPATPVAGDLWYNTNIGWHELMIYDASRGKWLSSSSLTFGFGRDTADGNRLLSYGIASGGVGTGIGIPRNATITRVFARAVGGQPDKTFHIMINDIQVSSFSLVASSYKSNTTNIDIDEDDYLWVEADAAGTPATDVLVFLWLKWRVT